jgi:hypothetical protein
MQAINLMDNTILTEYPNLFNHLQRIWALPEMKKYH